MITTKEIKIKVPDEYTSNYIESELKQRGFDVLKWAITEIKDGYCCLNISIIE